MATIHEERRTQLSRKLDGMDLAAFVVTSPASIFYLTGLTPSAPPGLVFSSDLSRPPTLVVRGIETEDVAQISPFPVVGTPFGSNGVEQIAGVVRAATNGQGVRVGFDEDVTLASKLLAMQSAMPWATLVPAGNLVMELRYVKSADEIAVMRRAAEVSDQAMLAAVETIRAGKTESAAAAAAEKTWRAQGLGPAYEVLIGSGRRSAALRRFPSLTVPGPDDLVRFDFAARVSPASGFGYNNDMTRTFTRDRPGRENKELLTVGLAVFEATVGALEPGITIGEAAEAGLREVRGSRYEKRTHMAGHGIGADVQESPAFAVGSTFVVQPGNCFAIEPMVVFPGERAVCFENSVVITQTGWESLNDLELRLWEE